MQRMLWPPHSHEHQIGRAYYGREENEIAKMFVLSRTGVILKGDYAK